MPIDFSNLKALDVTPESVAEYVFPMIPGEPSIFFAPATDANPAFLSERLRLSIERQAKAEKEPRGKGAGPMTVEQLAAQLDEDRETDRLLLARTCARRWGTAPEDVNGDTPPFTTDNCYDFLKALPNYMLDPLRNFCANIYNFVQRPQVTEGEARELGNA